MFLLRAPSVATEEKVLIWTRSFKEISISFAVYLLIYDGSKALEQQKTIDSARNRSNNLITLFL